MREVLIVETGEILRGLSLADAGDIVSSGRARWVSDLPKLVLDVPAGVETAALEAVAAATAPAETAEDATGDEEEEAPVTEIDEDLGDSKPRTKPGPKGRKRP